MKYLQLVPEIAVIGRCTNTELPFQHGKLCTCVDPESPESLSGKPSLAHRGLRRWSRSKVYVKRFWYTKWYVQNPKVPKKFFSFCAPEQQWKWKSSPSELRSRNNIAEPRWRCCAGCCTEPTEGWWRLPRTQSMCQWREGWRWQALHQAALFREPCLITICKTGVSLCRGQCRPCRVAQSRSPLPPNTWMSSCSKRYMTNVLTCGSSPTKKMMGKQRVNTAGGHTRGWREDKNALMQPDIVMYDVSSASP